MLLDAVLDSEAAFWISGTYFAMASDHEFLQLQTLICCRENLNLGFKVGGLFSSLREQ